MQQRPAFLATRGPLVLFSTIEVIMARKSNIAEQTSEAKLRSQLERYEALFGEIDSFVKFVQTEREQLRVHRTFVSRCGTR